jgi:type II secretory pathway component PulM
VPDWLWLVLMEWFALGVGVAYILWRWPMQPFYDDPRKAREQGVLLGCVILQIVFAPAVVIILLVCCRLPSSQLIEERRRELAERRQQPSEVLPVRGREDERDT